MKKLKPYSSRGTGIDNFNIFLLRFSPLESKIILPYCFMLSLLSFMNVSGATINVSTIGGLQSAINNASAGDIIILADGTYVNSTINISASNITVSSATPGGVFLNGTNVIDISGNHNTFSGFQFTSGSISGVVITVSGNYNILTQLNFKGYSAQKYINLQGQYDEISYCNFENKPIGAPAGNLIHIAPDATLSGYHRIRYCSFQNMPGAGGDNGNECIRISNGATSTYVSRTIVEFCFFNNTGPGDSEAISVKCQENVLRYNTNTNNQGANFCFRNGDNNIAYGNFFINAGGIRVKEANSIYCYNNYFENCGDGSITAPVKYVYVSPNLNNINVIHNTFVNGTSIELASGASSNTWANNIFKKTSGDIFTGSTTGITFVGNIYSGSMGVTIPSGMTNADPKLVMNSDGYYGLSSSSPAIDVSSSGYPAILDIADIDDDPSLLFDISGQSRPVTTTLMDVGCDEYTTGTISNRPLLLSDVGPSYLGGPVTSAQDLNSENISLSLYPNPASQYVRIIYCLSEESSIQLVIYSLSGQVEKILIENEHQPAGNFNLSFDATDLKDGMHFVRFINGNFTKTIKLIVTK
ncbi:MAG: T9SS type A sorting domain-containing protein [Bacteroidia bacterium]|nr:T9SS type A sorting domain-containing protein [Bacteroidia bacterium]